MVEIWGVFGGLGASFWLHLLPIGVHLGPMWAYLAPGVAPMPPLMDLHRISRDFAGQGGTPELAGGKGRAPLG